MRNENVRKVKVKILSAVCTPEGFVRCDLCVYYGSSSLFFPLFVSYLVSDTRRYERTETTTLNSRWEWEWIESSSSHYSSYCDEHKNP